jgi:hypothetical protein
MKKAPFKLGRLGALLAGVALLFACNAPFIPVPPPGATFTTQLVTDGSGAQRTVWTAHGLPATHAALATFFIFNENRGDGVITTARVDGTYDSPPFDGNLDDRVQLSYQTPGGDYSDSLCLLLREGSTPSLCPP